MTAKLTLKVVIPSKTAHLDEMRNSLDEMLPAHLAYDFQHIINIDDENEEESSDGKPDGVIEINDESTADVDGSAFFMHADFPIQENISYGKYFSAPKYDGSVQVKSPNKIDGTLQYAGLKTYNGIDSATAKVAMSCNWWFIPTGSSTFNKEFQHIGAIRYDGLRPQEIEYDDGMDELSTVEIEHVFEDELINPPQFDGANKYNCAENQFPTDRNGTLELKRYRHFDGAVSYNGGDINYFNGGIKADGKFNFEGNGVRAQIEIITDRLDGGVNVTRQVKETPLSHYIPEVIDFVPKTLDRQSTEISADVIVDTVKATTDEHNTLTVSRAMRYDGAKIYNGGNINYFNGGIKANGKFNFEGDGDRAKIEVIAIDLDGTFSISKPSEKNTPPLYVEQFDFVSPTYDEHKISAQFLIDDDANSIDNGGYLIVKRRLKFDGYAHYRGNFEHVEDKYRRFNGNLNYGGGHRVSADSIGQFDAKLCYGGRNGYKFIEYLSDLDGNTKFVDDSTLEKIPVATRSKLGFVIIGNNLDVDSNGKISLPENLYTPKFNAMNRGKLKTLFQNREG